jgi:hypothetical protein
MKLVMCAVVVVLAGAVPTVRVSAEEKSPVKEVPTKDLKLAPAEGGKATAPTEIKTAEELEKSPVLKGAAADVKKHVDFSKEKLVLFSWGGSGGDRITVAKADAKTVEFGYRVGLTLDFVMYVKLFVVPKDAAVKVVPVR